MKKNRLVIISFMFIFLIACKKPNHNVNENINHNLEEIKEYNNELDETNEISNNEPYESNNISSNVEEVEILNKSGMNINDRYNPPQGYTRVELEEDSFGSFLRNQQLKPYGELVEYYDGRFKNSQGRVYDSVFDINIGDRDLHQCADAIMLLRAEYLYSQERYDDISFHFVSGFNAEYSKWRQGNRIKVDGNDVKFYKATEADNSYKTFRKYMEIVMAYASTLSLEKELVSVDVNDIQIGDVFIKGGSPGHAIIVVDLAKNEEGESIFILAQSYMPAQQTQILINAKDKNISPWYSLKDETKLDTPEWDFNLDKLKRFE